MKLLNYSQYSGDSAFKNEKSFAVITKKTTTEAETTKILEVYNSSPDSKLQVIVGSKVIGEGRTLKNVRQIHILTPHWNNTETRQAIGRGIRAFSHDALPEKDKYVKVWRWCSIPVKHTSESVDLLFYKMSEDKDFKIKQIERIIKIVAVDCQLNKRRNLLKHDKDFSEECQYDKCDYTCDGFDSREIKDSKGEIRDTYNLFYGEGDISALTTMIKLLFRKQFTYHISQLFDHFADTPTIIVIRALKDIIDNSVELKNRYNFTCYLREQNDMYFLVDRVALPNSYTLSYYTENPPVGEMLTFNQISKLSQYKYLIDKINIIILTLDPKLHKKEIVKQLETFSIDIQEMFLEQVIAQKSHKDGISEIGKIIDEHYKNYIITDKDKIISTLLLDDKDILRCYRSHSSGSPHTSEWKDCDHHIMESLDELKNIEKISLENNDYGFYGIISKKTDPKTGKKIFSIKYQNEEEAKDNRNKYRGTACKTQVPKGRIANLAIALNIKPDRVIKVPPKKQAIDEILYENKQAIEKSKEPIHKYTAKELEKLSDEEFYTVYYWYKKNNVTATGMCDKIQADLERKGLIQYEK